MTSSPSIVNALAGGIASYFMILSAFSYNDAHDIEVDRINGFDRTNDFSRHQLILLTYLLWLGAFTLSALASWQAMVVASLSILLAYVYSSPRFNLKERFPFKTVVTALDASTACLMGASVGGAVFSTYTILSSVGFFTFFFILGPQGDFQDIKGDTSIGRRTFPIVMGRKKTLTLMACMPPVLAVLAFLSMRSVDVSNNHVSVIDTGLVISVCITTLLFIVLKMKRHLDDPKWMKRSRTTMRFLHILFQLSILAAIFIHG